MGIMTMTQGVAPTRVAARTPATVRRPLAATITSAVSTVLLALAVLVGVGLLSAVVAVLVAGDSGLATVLVGTAGLVLVGAGSVIAIRSRSY